MGALFRSMWDGWKRFAHWLGAKQAFVVYSLIYYGLLGPIALARRPFADPFQYRARRRPSFWIPRAPQPGTLADARRQ